MSSVFNCRYQRNLWTACFVAFVFVLAIATTIGEANAQTEANYRLTLASGDTIAGYPGDANKERSFNVMDQEKDQVNLAWRHPAFKESLSFPTGIVRKIERLSIPQSTKSRGSHRFTLRNGDTLFGNLKDIRDGNWFIDTALFGRVGIAQEMIGAMEPWQDGQSHRFSGPGFLDQWILKGEAGSWSEDAGKLYTERPISGIFREVGLPENCRIELEISWEGRPNFVIVIGTDQRGARASNAVRIEVWDSVFTLVRETNEEAEIIPIGTVDSYQGKARWSIEIDQLSGFARLQSIEPNVFAQLALTTAGGIEAGVFIENIEGNLSIESLEVSERARFEEVTGHEGTQVMTRDGRVVFVEIDTLEDGKLAILGNEESEADAERIAIDEVAAVRFQDLEATEDDNAEQLRSPRPDSVSGTITLVTIDGTRVTGELRSINHETISFKPLYSEQIWTLPFDSLLQLQNRTNGGALKQDTSLRYGKLILEDAALVVALRDAKSEGDTSCFRLAVQGAKNEVRLLTTVHGVLTFEKESGSKEPRKRNRSLLGSVVSAISGSSQDKRSGRGVHLRNGDSLPGTLLGFDGDGILFDSAITGRIRIPHQEIKAVDFNTLETVLQIDEEKKSRLLTIPRLRKKMPPQHLLISNDGDYLLGTVIGMDDQNVRMTKGLDEIEIPRRFLSKLIWFHKDELDTEVSPEEESDAAQIETEAIQSPEPPLQSFFVQAVQGDGVRLTFQPEQVGGGELIGNSHLLGVCLIDLKTVDRLILGASTTAESSQSPYHQWRLTHAPLPRVYSEDSPEEMASAGKEHSLVGQDAPELRLKRLDGGDFELSEYRGRIVVLDFWASWCGPCIRAMPQVDAAVAGFDPELIQLVAVNLQESPEQITPALERMGIDPTVVLDVDGVAAARYDATAIPQTVIIDKEGIVRRVYVGAGGNLQEQLKLAIEQVLSQMP